MEHYETKGDYAYHALREMILGGAVEPGSVLHQSALATTIGISTTPLREGLRRLASEGLVELGAHRDARVTDLSAEEARDLLEMRRALDPLAVGLAAERRTRDDITRIREAWRALADLPADVDGARELAAHRRFHTALYTASHNDLLVHSLDGLWDKADRYRRTVLAERTEAERATNACEHEALLGAVVAGDAENASAIMHRHIATGLATKALVRLSGRA